MATEELVVLIPDCSNNIFLFRYKRTLSAGGPWASSLAPAITRRKYKNIRNAHCGVSPGRAIPAGVATFRYTEQNLKINGDYKW